MTFILSVGTVVRDSFPTESAMLLTLIIFLITKELLDARPTGVAAAKTRRAFYLATVPPTLLFVAIVAVRSAQP